MCERIYEWSLTTGQVGHRRIWGWLLISDYNQLSGVELWGWWHDKNAAYLGEFWATQLLWLLSAADEYLNKDPVLKRCVFLWISVFVNFIVAFLRFVFTLSRHGVCHKWHKWHFCKKFWAGVIFSRTNAKNDLFNENCRKHYCLKQAEFFTK